MIRRVDLGPCPAYEYENDGPTAVVLPGAMLGGMPAVWWAIAPLHAAGWRVLLLWWEYTDHSVDGWTWVRERFEAAGDHHLVVGKSLGCYAAPAVETPAVWLTPALADPELVAAMRGKEQLLVGGTDDPTWDGAVAHELGEVLELEGADHGLARIDHAQRVSDAVGAFSVRALRRA